jgi:hypothetical protein
MARTHASDRRTVWFTCFAMASALLMPVRYAAGQVEPAQTELQKLVPEHANITQRMTLDFGNGIEPGAIAVIYMLPPVYAESYNAGLRILCHESGSGWAVAYEEKSEINPGGDEWTIEKVKAASGQEGLVVVNYESGAGTSTDWKLIAAVRGKFVTLDPKPIRDKVLRERHSVFGGYNGVKAAGDTITEEIAGYSEHQARCCPDKPRIAMHVRFTGRAIKLESVSEVPDAGPR